MTTPINSFQDILDAMERDPALRDALRRHILTDELLQVPARLGRVEGDLAIIKEDVAVLKGGQVRLEEGQARLEGDVAGLKEGQARLEGDVAGLKEGQARLEGDVAGLKEGQARLEGDVAGLKEGQARLEGDVANLKEGQARLEERVDRIGGDVSRLTGSDYESHVAGLIHRFLRRERGISATVFSTQREKSALRALIDDAEIQGLIQAWETDDLDHADLVLATAGGPGDYLLAEVSITIQQDDVERAKARAGLLARATGRSVTPFAVGAREEPGLDLGNVQVLLIPYRQDP